MNESYLVGPEKPRTRQGHKSIRSSKVMKHVTFKSQNNNHSD